MLVQQFLVQAGDVIEQAIEAVAGQHRVAAGVPHLAAPLAIGKQGDHVVGQSVRIAERRDQSVHHNAIDGTTILPT